MILGRVICFAAGRYPDKEALVDGARRFTYAELNARINRAVGMLRELGVERGDRVVMLLKNREEAVTAHWAMQKIGAVSTPLNWRYGPGELGYALEDSGAKAILFEEASKKAVEVAGGGVSSLYVGGDVPEGAVGFETALESQPDEEPQLPIAETDISVMLYTSGTTGRPKGVPRTHRNEHSAAMAHVIQSGNAYFDRTLGVMPFYHTMGVRSLLAMAIVNGCLVTQADWDPAAALERIERECINSLYLVPTLYHDIAERGGFDHADLSCLKKLGYAGAPMSSALTERLVDALQPDVFVNHLGSTEIYTFTICNRVAEKPTCAGRAGINEAVRIVGIGEDGGGDVNEIVRRGETGQLAVSLDSDEAFSGYWNRPDADAKALKDGWYLTGDLVFEDPEGDIYVVGRIDDMINSGGENIQPVEVEDVLMRHPKVAEAAVIGVPDDRWGQRVVAYVVARDDVTVEELDGFCKRSDDLADLKRPREYRFVDRLPKSPTGKLLRRRLGDRQETDTAERRR